MLEQILEESKTLFIALGSILGTFSVIDIVLIIIKLISNHNLNKKLDDLKATDYTKFNNHCDVIEKRLDTADKIYEETKQLNTRIVRNEKAIEETKQRVKHLEK